MSTQPEQILENNLISQLDGLEYAYVHINNEDGLLANLKAQLESLSISRSFPTRNSGPSSTIFPRAMSSQKPGAKGVGIR